MGYRCCLADGVVTYRSRTQSISVQSSTEAELIAANAAAKVTKYLQHWRLMKDIILIHLPGVVNPVDMLRNALSWVLHHHHAPYLMGHYGNPCR